ncbi:MAG: hypothetical protein LBR89_04565 [Holosporales bacterium]|jgi:hypothetical protein|nr:hypothetical protein [Holosporales bacterium]
MQTNKANGYKKFFSKSIYVIHPILFMIAIASAAASTPPEDVTFLDQDKVQYKLTTSKTPNDPCKQKNRAVAMIGQNAYEKGTVFRNRIYNKGDVFDTVAVAANSALVANDINTLALTRHPYDSKMCCIPMKVERIETCAFVAQRFPFGFAFEDKSCKIILEDSCLLGVEAPSIYIQEGFFMCVGSQRCETNLSP